MLLREEYSAQRRNAVRGAARKGRKKDWQPWLAAAALAVVVVAGGAYGVRRSHRAAAAAAVPAPAAGNRGSETAKAAAKRGANRGAERFQFYSMLPKAEVDVPTNGPGSPRAVTLPQPVETSGTYFLQVGAFATDTEAERIRSRLATVHLHGEIQRVTVEDRVLLRVRLGPFEDLGELNRVRRVLRDSRIEAGLVRVGD